MESLKVPKDSLKVDVLEHPYKLSKKGEKKNAGTLSVYETFEMETFREEKNICFADVGTVYAVPMDGLKRIVKINKIASFLSWHKETPYNEGEYKQYKIWTNKMGVLFVKPHYSLQFTVDGEEFEILFPSYELETIKNLTGLSVEEN